MGEKAPQRRQDDGRLSLLPTLTERNIRTRQNLWIKEARGDNDPYSLEQFELNCDAHQLRMMSAANYDAAGNMTGSHRGGNWTPIIPETLGENLYDGVCRAN